MNDLDPAPIGLLGFAWADCDGMMIIPLPRPQDCMHVVVGSILELEVPAGGYVRPAVELEWAGREGVTLARRRDLLKRGTSRMYRRGSESWRFGHGDEGYLTTALEVRDAAHLPVPAAADIPPPLTAGLALGQGLVLPAEQEGVADDWVAWWRRLVGQAAREASRQWDDAPVSDDPFARIRHRVSGRDEVFDPPDFRTLAATAALQAAAQAVLTASRGRPHDRDIAGDPVDRTVFKWEIVKVVAEQTAAELGVSVGSMTGYAHVLEVDGEWWYLAGPGCALCSTTAARDPATSAVILREVFSSGRRPLSA